MSAAEDAAQLTPTERGNLVNFTNEGYKRRLELMRRLQTEGKDPLAIQRYILGDLDTNERST